MDSTRKGPANWRFDVFIVVMPYMLLNKQSSDHNLKYTDIIVIVMTGT